MTDASIGGEAMGAPPRGAPYRSIGPFDQTSLPAGLRAEHRLKEGTWGLLKLRAGSLTFVWDDGSGKFERLAAPAELTVPPRVMHHVEGAGPFVVTIEFYRGD